MKPNITVSDQAKIRIAAIDCKGKGKLSQKTIDLTPYAGQHVRVWIDAQGKYTLDPGEDLFWQVAEFDVPEIKFSQTETKEMDKSGALVMKSEALPLDLTKVKIKKWDMPEK